MDSLERKEYDNAFDLVPELVVKESRYLDFLRIDRFDPYKAAKRMATYWKSRKKLFRDRWLLPLTQTGTGALNMEDVELLRKGVLTVVSRPFPQCPLFVIDWSKSTHEQPSPLCQVRVVYYFIMLYADEISRADGIEIASFVSSDRKRFMQLRQDIWEMVLSGLPARIKKYYIVQNHEEGRENYLDYATYRIFRSHQYNSSGRLPLELIKGDSKEGVIQSLELRGVAREHVPFHFGGSLDSTSAFDDFVRGRLSVEETMSAARLRANMILPSSSMKAMVQVKRGPNESQEDFARRRNAVYARRVYQRRQAELTGLQRQHEFMKMSKTQLEQDNLRLEGLLAQARSLVAATMDPSLDGKPAALSTPSSKINSTDASL